MTASYYFPTGSRLHRTERRIELSIEGERRRAYERARQQNRMCECGRVFKLAIDRLACAATQHGRLTP